MSATKRAMEERNYKLDRETKLRILKGLGVTSLPLNVAAEFLPVLPEWREFQRPLRKRKVRR